MNELLLLRHAQSEWNALGRWQGWADPALSERGEREAADAAPSVHGLGIQVAASSDLRRARRTLELLLSCYDPGPTIVIEPALRERDVGAWSGLTREQIEEGWPGQLEAWTSGRLAAPPGGESATTMMERILRGLASFAGAHRGRPALVVTHGGVIRMVERHLGLQPRPVPNLSGRWLAYRGRELGAGPVFSPVATDADPGDRAAASDQ